MDNAMKRDVRVFDDIDAISRAAASLLVECILGSPEPTFSIALSGGSTPERLYRLLGDEHAEDIPWGRLHLFWGDERFVPPDDPASNYRMVRRALLDLIEIPRENIHPIETRTSDGATSAARYEAELHKHFGGTLPRFDMNILGMGDDGHTASLFPGRDYHESNDGSIVALTTSPIAPHTRITLTMPVLQNARTTIFLVAGQKKRPILDTILNDPDRASRLYPAAMVEPVRDGKVIWMVDRNAMEG